MAAPIIGRAGVKGTAIACIAVISVCFLSIAVTTPGAAWIPLRFALGTAAFTLFTATQTWVHMLCREEERGAVIGLFGFIWSVGFAAGPLIISAVGIEGLPPFIAGVACLAASAIPLAFGDGARERTYERTESSTFLGLIRWAPVPMFTFVSLGLVDASNDTFLPLYGMHLGLGEREAVWLLTILLVGITIAHLPAGWMCDRMSRRGLLGASAGLGGVIAATLPLLPGEGWFLGFAIAALGLMIGTIWTVAVVMIGQRFRGADLIRANACEGALYGCGAVAGPLMIGASHHLLGFDSYPMLVAGTCLGLLVLVAVVGGGARTDALAPTRRP